MHEADENRETLWVLLIALTVWALHFLLSYVTAAVWCAKAPHADFAGVRIAVAVYTLLALALIALALRRSRSRRRVVALPGHDGAAQRHRFLGHAGVLLGVLAIVAVAYDALVVVFIGACA